MAQHFADQPGRPLTPAGPSNETLTLGSWMLTILLTFIPIVNVIMYLVWAFGSGTPAAKQNWARACILWWVIGLLIGLVTLIGLIVLGIDPSQLPQQ